MWSRIAVVLIGLLLAACAHTEYKEFDGGSAFLEGKGGTKVVVDGMEFWDNGDPPRRYKVIGIIEDERPGGLVPMASLRSDMVSKAKAAGGDAVVQLSSDSQISGFINNGMTMGQYQRGAMTSMSTGFSAPMRKNVGKFAVVKYLDR